MIANPRPITRTQAKPPTNSKSHHSIEAWMNSIVALPTASGTAEDELNLAPEAVLAFAARSLASAEADKAPLGGEPVPAVALPLTREI